MITKLKQSLEVGQFGLLEALRWMYTGRIFGVKEEEREAIEQRSDFRDMARLVCAWVEGERLVSLSFKDAVLDAIRLDGRIAVDFHEVVWPRSQPSSAIRKLAVDVAVWCWEPDHYRDAKRSAKWDGFFVDVAMAHSERALKKTKTAPDTIADTCHYHEHVAAGKPCYKTFFPW